LAAENHIGVVVDLTCLLETFALIYLGGKNNLEVLVVIQYINSGDYLYASKEFVGLGWVVYIVNYKGKMGYTFVAFVPIGVLLQVDGVEWNLRGI